MDNFENIKAFEAALKENKELQETFKAAKKRIAENKEAASDAELLVKAAAEVGFVLTVAEIDRAMAEAQELNDEELEIVSGGGSGWCWKDYGCVIIFEIDDAYWA